MSYSTRPQEYLAAVIAMTRTAGDAIMHYYSSGYETTHKDDKSPVTDADIAANELITTALQSEFPRIPVVAEEAAHQQSIVGHSLFWLVDPLDGTRAFVAGEPEFTVNIALIENGLPVLGVILLPAEGLLYYGGTGLGAFRVAANGTPEAIAVRPVPQDGVVVVRSKSHPSAKTEAFLHRLSVREMIAASSSMKFCRVAEGSADIYPRFGRTMEWDTAAGHAILNAAGGRVEAADGTPLTYGKAGFENPHFVAYGY